jgi:hypothetical protein
MNPDMDLTNDNTVVSDDNSASDEENIWKF